MISFPATLLLTQFSTSFTVHIEQDSKYRISDSKGVQL